MKLFSVGPVEMYKHTLSVASHQLPYFRTGEFSDIVLKLDMKLKEIINAPDKSEIIILTASGTGAMEASVMNCFTEKDKLLVVSGGDFGKRFEKICEIYKIPYNGIKLDFGETLDYSHLAEYENRGYTGLLVNIHETSTGQLYDIDMISEFCERNGMFLIVDAISSFLADTFDMKRSRIDLSILSSQKALALSPGLSIVILSERLYKEKIMNNNVKSMYFNFNDYIINSKRGQTPFTPAVGIILELIDMIERIEKIGVKNKINQTKILADRFRKGIVKLDIELPNYPLSNALTPIIVDGKAKKLFQILKDKYSLIVTPSGGDLADKLIRVGHIGNLSVEDIDELLNKIDISLKET